MAPTSSRSSFTLFITQLSIFTLALWYNLPETTKMSVFFTWRSPAHPNLNAKTRTLLSCHSTSYYPYPYLSVEANSPNFINCWEQQLSLFTTTDRNGFVSPWVCWNIGVFCRKIWELGVIHECVLLSMTIPREKEVSHGPFWEEKSTLMFWMVRNKSSSWNGPWLMMDWDYHAAELVWGNNCPAGYPGMRRNQYWCFIYLFFLERANTSCVISWSKPLWLMNWDYHVELDQSLSEACKGIWGRSLGRICMKPDR